MRAAFFEVLHELFVEDERVMFLTADLGYKLFDGMRRHAPARVVNVGIREAGMVGLAAGLAKEGMRPFVYSIAPFVTLRCLEVVKLDLCLNRAPVVVVGVGAGYTYGKDGVTHYGTDDLSVLMPMPGLTVCAPADSWEVRAALPFLTRLDGPSYLRIGRAGEPRVHSGPVKDFDLGRALRLSRGGDGTIIATGSMVHPCVEAARSLAASGVRVEVASLHTLKPFDAAYLEARASLGKPILTVEENCCFGGLGSVVASALAKRRRTVPFDSLALEDRFPAVCGSREHMRDLQGLTAKSIKKRFLGLTP